MSTAVHRLGEPPTLLGSRAEAPILRAESSPGAGDFRTVRWAGESVSVELGANDKAAATAEITINLAGHAALGGQALRDWQIHTAAGTAVQPWNELLGGRRIQIITGRPHAQDNWCLFEGFVDRLELGWSGDGRPPRWAKLGCTSTLIAADRELAQAQWGQWRRNRQAELDLATPPANPDLDRSYVCIRAGVPAVFNPEGRPNCHPDALRLFDEISAGGTEFRQTDGLVFVFCDPEFPRAQHWTVARMLRYIQWAAMQPFRELSRNARYDRLWNSDRIAVARLERANRWTRYGLRWGNLTTLLDTPATPGEEPLVRLQRNEGSGDNALLRTMLRALPDIAIEGMSTLEALAFVCERADVLMGAEHVVTAGGQVQTQATFAIPGFTPSAQGSQGVVKAGRQTRLRVASDRTFDTEDGTEGGTALGDAERIRRTTQFSGSLLFDDAKRRGLIYVAGDTTRYEITLALRPGWPVESHWDVSPNDAAHQAEELAFQQTDSWKALYVAHADTPGNLEKRETGRLWVANEDGAYTLASYQRPWAPWNDPELWRPFRFAAEGDVLDLAVRGNDGWSTRRRRLIKPRARLGRSLAATNVSLELGVHVEISFDGGTTWYSNLAKATIEEGRIAIYFTTPDMREVVNPADATDNFAKAFLQSRLRVQVTADVEGDDALYAWSGSSRAYTPWGQYIDRRGKMARQLRERDGAHPEGGESAAYDVLRLPAARGGPALYYPASRNDQAEADALALRLADELNVRRVTGRAVIPWLTRPLDGAPWDNYRVGDEVVGLVTSDGREGDSGQDSGEMIDFGFGETVPRYPRVVGLAYRWSEGDTADCSTTLTIEDRVYDVDDVIAAQEPPEPRATAFAPYGGARTATAGVRA